METKMTHSRPTDHFNSQDISDSRLVAIYRIIQGLKDQGLDCNLFEHALEKSDSVSILKQLAVINEEALAKKNLEISPAKSIDTLVNQTISYVLSFPIWASNQIHPIEPVVIGAGGFSWIAQVELQGERLALSIPKYRSDDYDKRVITRRRFTDMVPEDIGFDIPRVRQIFHTPFHAALMTVAEGDNCYKRCFDQNEKGISSEGSVLVFKQLGYMAAGFSGVIGKQFGAIAEPTHTRAKEHLAEKIEVVRQFILSADDKELEPFGYDPAQLMTILNWVEADLDSGVHSPKLVHGDLSPWNLHHESARDIWTITDGDDSFFGLDGQQIGVCLMSMRGNYNQDWIKAIVDGYSSKTDVNHEELLLRGSAYGIISYGLYAAATDNSYTGRSWNLRAIAPLIKIFKDVIQAHE